MTTTNTQGAAIGRYKIGYYSDDWGIRTSTPSALLDEAGTLVKYADHIAAMQETEATHLRELTAYRLTVENLEREIAAQQGAQSAAAADTVVLEAALRAIHQAIDLIGAPDTERLRTVRRVLRGAVVVAEDCKAPQADSQPAHQWDVGYPPLPVPHTNDVEDAQCFYFTESQMSAYVDADRAARAPADSVTAPAGGVDDAVDAIALARYKVVPAHESVFHRFAVVAGDGKQQLYLGREIECANMARKFAGAFLDGAFYQANIAPTPPAQAADSVLEDAEIDRIVPALEPVSEDFPAEWAVWKDRERIREELRAARKQGEKQ